MQNIREDVLASLRRYADQHIETDGFLRAVLENDLMGAVGRADEYNLRTLPEICAYVYNEMPANCYGNRAKVREWLLPREHSQKGGAA